MFPDGVDESVYDLLSSQHDGKAAARSGDLNYLQIFQREFGGMFFHSDLVQISLESHQFEFFRQYVLLCAPSLLKNEFDDCEDESCFNHSPDGLETADKEDSHGKGGNTSNADELSLYYEDFGNPTDDWMEYRSEVFLLVLMSKISPELRLKVLIEVIDEIFPNFPKREEIDFPTGYELGNAGPCYPPEHPLWEDPDYPNMTKSEYFILLVQLYDSINNFHILRYFCEQRGARFSQHFLHNRRNMRYIEMLEYILDHVEDDVDIEPYRDAHYAFSDDELVVHILVAVPRESDNRLECEEAKHQFKRMFYKREEMLRRGLAVVHGLYRYLHDNLDEGTELILYRLWYRPIGATWEEKAKAQEYLNFLIETFDEIISEQLTSFPEIGRSIADLLPNEIEQFMIPLRC